MNNSAANLKFSQRHFVTLLGVAAVALVGAALFQRGPALFDAPAIAEHPVIFPDGTELHVQKYEVTVAEWNRCHAEGACALSLHAAGNHTEAEMPATGVSYTDVSEYLKWINRASRHSYRLPTLQEWEYMAAEVLPKTPNPFFTDPELSWASAYLLEPQTKRTLLPKGAFATTKEGIVDLNGSVWEWTADCYAGVSETEIDANRCPAFFVGGEHIAAIPFLVRDPARGGCAVGTPPAHLGMRLVSERPWTTSGFDAR